MANKATRAGPSVVSGPGVRWMEHVSIVSCSAPGGAGVRPSYWSATEQLAMQAKTTPFAHSLALLWFILVFWMCYDLMFRFDKSAQGHLHAKYALTAWLPTELLLWTCQHVPCTRTNCNNLPDIRITICKCDSPPPPLFWLWLVPPCTLDTHNIELLSLFWLTQTGPESQTYPRSVARPGVSSIWTRGMAQAFKVTYIAGDGHIVAAWCVHHGSLQYTENPNNYTGFSIIYFKS